MHKIGRHGVLKASKHKVQLDSLDVNNQNFDHFIQNSGSQISVYCTWIIEYQSQIAK